MVVIGGNGTQAGSAALSERAVAVVGVASTIDNDLVGAEFAATSAEQRRRWAQETTPEERLAWLEEALRFAERAGALQRRGPNGE